MGIDISGVYSRRTRELTRKCDMMTFVPRRSDFLFSNKSISLNSVLRADRNLRANG